MPHNPISSDQNSFSFAQFAYNEVSFMLIRLLQHVSDIRLVQEVNPEAVPPLGFAESKGSDGTDKVFFKNHLTMYVKVRAHAFISLVIDPIIIRP